MISTNFYSKSLHCFMPQLKIILISMIVWNSLSLEDILEGPGWKCVRSLPAYEAYGCACAWHLILNKFLNFF